MHVCLLVVAECLLCQSVEVMYVCLACICAWVGCVYVCVNLSEVECQFVIVCLGWLYA